MGYYFQLGNACFIQVTKLTVNVINEYVYEYVMNVYECLCYEYEYKYV